MSSIDKEQSRRITKEQLKKILAEHKEWLKNGTGKPADFTGKDLSGMDLSGENLTKAFFRGANLTNTNFSESRLRSADFTEAIMENAKFCRATMSWILVKDADAKGADFTETNLYRAIFDKTDLRGAILERANLCRTSITKVILDEDTSVVQELWQDVDLRNAKVDEVTLAKIIPNHCLPGKIIGYKKVKGVGNGAPLIAELEIPADARRVNAASRQCRCDRAKVLSITHLDGTPFEGEAVGWIYPELTYKVGELIVETEFSEDRRTSQARGIHFFLTREEAENYGNQEEAK